MSDPHVVLCKMQAIVAACDLDEGPVTYSYDIAPGATSILNVHWPDEERVAKLVARLGEPNEVHVTAAGERVARFLPTSRRRFRVTVFQWPERGGGA